MRRVALALVLSLAAAAPAAPAFAWGAHGHRLVGRLATEALPAEVPGFLRTPRAIDDIGELARELDRSKGSGKIHDHDRDAGHFVDIDEEGRVLGGPKFAPFPATKADYETGLRAANLDMWKAGYLQYSIIDGYQQLVKDFTYWRILTIVEKRAKSAEQRRYYRADRIRREALLIRDLGVWAHYVGDASQPLHASIHYNGWGDYPNPKGYSQERSIHGVFEGEAVTANVTAASAKARMQPFDDCQCAVEQRVADFLVGSAAQAEPIYVLWADKVFKEPNPRAAAFLNDRIAAGASELRDLVVLAWRESANGSIGYRPTISVKDVESGKADPWKDLYGKD
ncbi:S1/P1 Nuclease [Caulobacter sp. NIBR2454]|uniref:S1/P1 Nuclease n=1 Tax=Caulobacter sp. NIBR2454 TaxID=3015996 RepID=UPI0022B67810|nr:S1/P1 Nuclease [Caulobacter sp. NIBR2454]